MPSRKALLIGINYTGTENALNGCINDVQNMKAYLVKNGYDDNDITMITDITPIKPTRTNMINAIFTLILSGADNLFLHYSGHGSFEPDLNSDEDDRRDETIVPLDFQSAGEITDDQLRGLLTFLNPKSKLVVVFDCCHSGTGMDLTYTLERRTNWSRERTNDTWMRVPSTSYTMTRSKIPQTPGTVILLSGCLDDQTSADAYEESKYQGAMTYSLLRALNDSGASKFTWLDLITKIQKTLTDHRYKQVANLSSGTPLNLSDPIFI